MIRATSSQQRVILLTATLAGAFVRLIHPLTSDYPLNDGGLFYTLTRDLLAAGGALPRFTAYNQSAIPYAYPPLAFYLTAGIVALTRLPLMTLLRLLPPLLSCFTIPAFYLLARRLLPAPRPALLATFAFALLPTAFDPLIVGAGLTRAPGLLFALLALARFHDLLNAPRTHTLAQTVLLASLTTLSHPGMAWFTAYSSLILLAFHLRNPEALKSTLGVAAGTILLTAPWWGTLLARHGVAALLSPYQTERFSLAALLTPFTLLFTNEPLVDFLAVLAFFGFLACLRQREHLIPTWLLSIFLFEPRLGAVYSAAPAALLAGIGAEFITGSFRNAEAQSRKTAAKNNLSKLALGFLFIYTLTAAYLAPRYNALNDAEAVAMNWVRSNTPVQATFIVLTGNSAYGTDYVSEWFPALSERASLATPQGYEWQPGGEFNRRTALHASLQACRDFACLQTWAQTNAIRPHYIYISTKALAENHRTLALPEIAPIFQNNAAAIYPWPGE